MGTRTITRQKISAPPMPTSDLPGWTLVYNEDFLTPATVGLKTTLGTFGWVYGVNGGYPNNDLYGYEGFLSTDQDTTYRPSEVLSAFQPADGSANGVMDYYPHYNATSGEWVVACPQPYQVGQTFGRYAMRARCVDNMPGYKTAFLWWPTNNAGGVFVNGGNWNLGEFDYPEANLTTASIIGGFVHQLNPPGNPNVNAYSIPNTGVPYAGSGWHVYETEWIPGNIKYFLDGVQVGSYSGVHVPTVDHRWSLQLEGALNSHADPDVLVAGHFQVDWLAAWAYNP